MKLYSAFIKKNEAGKIEDVILLKEGFSFPAFIFNGLWFLYHKMYCEFLAIILINFSFTLFENLLSDFDILFLQISFIFIVALNANHWLSEHLKKKNYQFIGLIFGNDLVSAKLRFIKNFEQCGSEELIEFDDAILNPKLHRQIMKLKKSNKFSAA